MDNKECKNGVCTISEADRVLAQELNAGEANVEKEEVSVFLFGKKECPLCEETKTILDEMNNENIFDSHYFDLDTVDGLSKAAYYNAFDLPVTVIFKDGREMKRWNSEVPDADLLKENIL